MPGRKNPKATEAEKKREYRLMQKRSYGDEVTGDLAEDLSEKGAVGEIERERRAWAEKRDAIRRHGH